MKYMLHGSGWVRFVFLALVVVSCTGSRCSSSRDLNTSTGQVAHDLTYEMVSFGPRPSGSATLERVRAWISEKISDEGLPVSRDTFLASTPIGEIEMVNLSYVIPGRNRENRILLLAHYESKRFLGFDFVGANDSASAVALLMALTPRIREQGFADDVEIVFVDGEESFETWTEADSLYGSRHLASQLGSGKPVRAALVLDMIGDRDLKLIHEPRSDERLRGFLQAAAQELGATEVLDTVPKWVDDDHRPLIEAGVPTLHLMDFTFGGEDSPGTYWHTPEDTMDKVSVKSLSLVGELAFSVLRKIESQ